MKIVVIGGTGKIGARVVDRLTTAGHDAVAASPSLGVNSATGEGLAAALRDAAVVVDVVEARSSDPSQVKETFAASTRNIATMGRAAGVQHHLLLSIVGTPALQQSPYFQAKQVQEELTRAGGLRFTIVRATQFFEFLGSIADFATRDGVVRLPATQLQPCAADDVSRAIADLATGEPADGVVEIAGPEVAPMADFVGAWLRHCHDPRPIEQSPDTPYNGARVDAATLVPSGPATRLPTRFEDWLRSSGNGSVSEQRGEAATPDRS